MQQLQKTLELSDDQARAVERFRDYHSSGANRESVDREHHLEWRIDDYGDITLICDCGATLHVTEPIYVSIEPQSFKLVEDTSVRRIVYEACGGDSKAFEIIRGIMPEMFEGNIPGIERLDSSDEKGESWLRQRSRSCGVASESLFQSALVTLPDEAFEHIRLHPSSIDMHFGLGMHLRNRFLHSGLIYNEADPDYLSGQALDKLIRHCLPEFRGYDLVYDRIDSGVLYDAYRYCIEVRGKLPEAELKKHYDILLEAQGIYDSNPFSILDEYHHDQRRAWDDRAWEKRKEYDLATLREIWNFETIRNDLGKDVSDRCEELCLAARDAHWPGFMPSEIAYVLAGSNDEMASRALDWAVRDSKVAELLPDELLERQDQP